MTGIVTAYRSVFLSADTEGIHFVMLSFVVSWIIFLFGAVFFQKMQVRFGDEL